MATKISLELKELSDAELKNDLAETQEEYKKLKFDHAVKGLDNPLDLREVRRNIARLKTEERRRELAACSEADLAKRSKIRARRRK